MNFQSTGMGSPVWRYQSGSLPNHCYFQPWLTTGEFHTRLREMSHKIWLNQNRKLHSDLDPLLKWGEWIVISILPLTELTIVKTHSSLDVFEFLTFLSPWWSSFISQSLFLQWLIPKSKSFRSTRMHIPIPNPFTVPKNKTKIKIRHHVEKSSFEDFQYPTNLSY